LEDAIEQNEKVSSSDALGTFWKLLGALIQEGRLTQTDYDLQEQWFESVRVKRDGQSIPVQQNFDKRTWVLYLDFDRAYQKYMEAHRSIFGTTGLGLQTMMDYAHNHWSYIGLKASHYFQAGNGKRTSAHMFNYTELAGRGVMPDFKGITQSVDPEPDNSWMEDKPKTEQTEIKMK
jgi:hypothetical protein